MVDSTMPSGASDPVRPPIPSAAFDFDQAVRKQLEKIPEGHSNLFVVEGSKGASGNAKGQAALYIKRPDGWELEVYIAGEQHHGLSGGAQILKSW